MAVRSDEHCLSMYKRSGDIECYFQILFVMQMHYTYVETRVLSRRVYR